MKLLSFAMGACMRLALAGRIAGAWISCHKANLY